MHNDQYMAGTRSVICLMVVLILESIAMKLNEWHVVDDLAIFHSWRWSMGFASGKENLDVYR